MNKTGFLILISSFLLFHCAKKKELVLNKQAVILSSIKGEKSKIDTLTITNKCNSKLEINTIVKGENYAFFKLLTKIPKFINPKETIKIPIQFLPKKDFIGVVNAELILNNKDSIGLNGLSTKGLEGKNEPPLSAILQTLNYKINIGWQSLANTIKPKLQGEELRQVLFIKANKKAVEMIPIARYSPKFQLPFGYYTLKENLPILNEVGVLSDSKFYPEHQTLFPKIDKGTNSFDPNQEPFGVYTSSPSHTAYSEDKWNKKFHKKKAVHACRVYAMKDANGTTIPNQFLVCFEEAFNGDYQDYVFILKNVAIFK